MTTLHLENGQDNGRVFRVYVRADKFLGVVKVRTQSRVDKKAVHKLKKLLFGLIEIFYILVLS